MVLKGRKIRCGRTEWANFLRQENISRDSFARRCTATIAYQRRFLGPLYRVAFEAVLGRQKWNVVTR